MTINLKSVVAIMFLWLNISMLFAQENIVNYDEEKVGDYKLPEVLTELNGNLVKTKKEWIDNRKGEILNLFKTNLYGEFPASPSGLHFVIRQIDKDALSGKAICKQVRCFFTASNDGPFMDILLYLPAHIKKAPVFIGLNFRGNQSVNKDANIEISEKYFEYIHKSKANISDTLNRGEQARRWEVETLIKNGYGVATAYYGDLEMDYVDGWKIGIRNTLQKNLNIKPSEWGAIGAWAWGLSRIMDYLVTDNDVDSSRVIVTGHSRLGKAALWAGANDARFAAVVSNNSGEGGAALSRRWYGETISRLNDKFPHWFIDKYKDYNDNVANLPVDQHMLLALIAPKPLYVASATKDRWSDPRGEFLGLKNAEPVYNLFDKKVLLVENQPKPDFSVGNVLRYHVRTGGHEILLFDWLQYIKFANENLHQSNFKNEK